MVGGGGGGGVVSLADGDIIPEPQRRCAWAGYWTSAIGYEDWRMQHTRRGAIIIHTASVLVSERICYGQCR